jgi:sugar lactone lactonase YvrE
LALLLLAAPATSHAANLFLANEGLNIIEEINSSGGEMGPFASSGLSSPVGLAFDSAGSLYVGNNGNSTIVKFTSMGGVLSSNGTVFTSSNLGGPEGMAFDSAGNLYVANDNGNIVKFTSTGGVLSSSGTVIANVGSGAGGLAFDANGNLYVAIESGYGSNASIEKFTLSGGVWTSAGAFGNSASLLSFPLGLAFDSAGNLYVGDQGNSDIVKFNPSGTGAVFSTDVDGPWGLAFDSAGNLYEADNWDNDIEKFPLVGGVLSSNASVFTSSLGGGQTPLHRPTWPFRPGRV